MGKLIFYIIIVMLIYWISKSRHPKQKQVETSLESIEDMVSCAHCGVYLPKSETISSHNKYFCCNEHCNQYIDTPS